MIKAIETTYNGYRFRSRLEARWAVFFDTLGVKYEYEKEGYDLDGMWYLPDFWLPELKRWIEIKGQKPTGEECEKARELENGTGYPCCIFYGLPGENDGLAYYTCSHESNGGKRETYDLRWVTCPVCFSVDVAIRCYSECWLYSEVEGIKVHNSCIYEGNDYFSKTDCVDEIEAILRQSGKAIFEILCKYSPEPLARDDAISRMLENLTLANCELLNATHTYNQNNKRLIAAYTAARQARFERGQQS